MKCVSYEIKAKKTGKTIIENIGWFDENTNIKAYLAKQYNPRLFEIIIK